MKEQKKENTPIITIISAVVFFLILAVFGKSQAAEHLGKIIFFW